MATNGASAPPAEERDEQLIEEGRALVQRVDSAQLRVGRLALEFAPMGEAGYRSGAGERAAMYAEAVGLETSTLKVYRSTAHAWSVTDVADGEFPFALLQALVSVGDKEGLVKLLRTNEPPNGKPRWGAQGAIEFAAEHGFLSATRQRLRNVSQTAVPRPANLVDLGETLRKMSFAKLDPSRREVLDPLLAKIEGEAARLRKELNALGAPPRPRLGEKRTAASA